MFWKEFRFGWVLLSFQNAIENYWSSRIFKLSERWNVLECVRTFQKDVKISHKLQFSDPRTSFYNAFLITCPIPNHLYHDSSTYHASISPSVCPKEPLSAIPVQTGNNLKFHSRIPVGTGTEEADPEKRIRIGVCVKGLDFLDEKELSARRLVEWIELNLILGAESVTFYSYYVPGRLRRVLTDYEANRKVRLVRFWENLKNLGIPKIPIST